MEVQEYSIEVAAHCWTKKSEIGLIEEGKRNSLFLLTSPLPQGGTGQY